MKIDYAKRAVFAKPGKETDSLSYWCSWHTQNIVAKIDCMKKYSKEEASLMLLGENGSTLARSMLNEELCFGEDGYAYQYESVRGDLYFLMDDGWDVDYNTRDEELSKFGSLIMNEERFPSIKGLSPAQRLKVINEKLKSLGWKGLGIWVASQRCGEDFREPLGEKDIAYWRERILWCKEAEVTYWKVDWGVCAGKSAFRRMLTELGQELYPALVIEHATCMCPLNTYDHPDPESRGRYMSMERVVENAKKLMAFSEVYRSYDVLNALCVPTTLDRVGSLLQWSGAIVNGEDECYINAALGCACGIMRSHYCQETAIEVGDDRGFRLQEVTAALRWQRVTPAFAGGTIAFSDEILFDNRVYQKCDSWCDRADGKEFVQGAPAITARNLATDSIRVEAKVKPYVAASLHPNGAYAVGIFPRVIDGYHHYPKASVHCDIPEGVDTLGCFGVNCDVYLHMPTVPQKVLVQSLIGDEMVDCTDQLLFDTTVCITAAEAEALFHATDKTAPALLVHLEF